jgi:predicted ATPase
MEPEELFRVQAYMNAIFQKEIDAGVRTIGYFTRSHERGLATEIEGYSDEFLAAMSRRAAEITAEKKARGVEGAEADEIINKALRRGKEDWDPELLRGKWLEEAASLGQDPIGLKTTADQTTPECWSQERRKSYAAAAVEYAFDSLMEHQAVVDRYEVMERALQFALCSPLVFEDIEGALDHRQQIAQPGHGSILAVDHYREGRPGERYTTSAMKSAENEIVQIALGGKGRALPVTDLRRDQWNEFKAQYREREVNGKKIQLNDSQLLAIFLVVRSSDQTMILRGAAGVGKSTLLESVSEISEQISKAGYQLRGTSPTTSATGNLVEIGLQAETLAARNLREIKPTEPAQFVVLDEGSLADTLAVLALMRSLRPDKDRLLIAYDPRQHAAVGAGRPVEQMEAQGVQTITLEKIVRQNENPEKDQSSSGCARHPGQGTGWD